MLIFLKKIIFIKILKIKLLNNIPIVEINIQ